MKKLKRLWMPALLGILLMATVAGAASARPDARPVEQGWRVLTVPSTSCIPHEPTPSWSHWGDRVECASDDCQFACVVNFPAAGEQAVGAVYVKRVTMYAFDNGVASYAVVRLAKAYPPTGAKAQMAWAQSIGSTDDPQTVMDTSIINNPVYRVQGPFIWITIHAGAKAYGAYIHYTW
jgi:hypothetical protein